MIRKPAAPLPPPPRPAVPRQTFGEQMAARMAAQNMGPKPTLAGGGSVKAAKPKMGSASSRADGCAIRGKTRA
jgi:hypothetical protein